MAARRGVGARVAAHRKSDLALTDFADVPHLRALFRGPGETRAIADRTGALLADCDGDLPPVSPARHVAEGAVRLLAPIL